MIETASCFRHGAYDSALGTCPTCSDERRAIEARGVLERIAGELAALSDADEVLGHQAADDLLVDAFRQACRAARLDADPVVAAYDAVKKWYE